MEERNRVFRVMKRLQLPFWHPVCCTQLFYKVSPCPALDLAVPSLSTVVAQLAPNLHLPVCSQVANKSTCTSHPLPMLLLKH